MSALRKNGRAGQPQRPSAIRSPRRIRNAPAEIRRSGPDLDAQVTALYIMGIMLTAGKIAMLGSTDRRKNRQYVKECHDRLQEALELPGAYERLTTGYRIKARVFRAWPVLYLFLYHLQKSMGSGRQ